MTNPGRESPTNSSADDSIQQPQPHHRPVRSFVIRSARMTRAQRRAFDLHWPEYGIDPGDSQLNYTELFHRDAPTYLEIGFGMGQSLVAMARMRPDDNFIGVDVCKPGVGSVIAAAKSAEVTNLRIIEGDAVELLRQRINSESLSGVYIFFPDPWPKRRHQKRRLIQTPFVELVCSRLQPGGVLHVATDWQDYAEQIERLLSGSELLTNCAADSPYSPRPDYRSLTKYEARGQRLGHGVWDLIYRKN